jgi:predicted GNAT family acetyltransferase
MTAQLNTSPFEFVFHVDALEFARAVTSLLEVHEAENGLLIGMILWAASPNSPPSAKEFMLEAKKNGIPCSAALCNEHNLIISRGEAPVWEGVAQRLRSSVVNPPGVVGPAKEAELMAQAWAKARGCTATLKMDQGLYELRQVQPPKNPAPGCAREATAADQQWVADCLMAFQAEVIPHEPRNKDTIFTNAGQRIQTRMAYLWEAEGKPVALASLSRPTRNGIAINAVYTPPSQRRKGYAENLVAAVSAEGLKRGKKFCVLYSDLANPTSNGIYQRIGYRRIADSRHYQFKY